MTTIRVETKNQVDIGKKPRVYFTCHPDDFEKYFRKICDDIFRTHDCAVYYTEDMSEIISEDEKETTLGRNNLFVVPVTFRLLSKPNRAMDEDIPYAIKEHIPVLPIMMESGIDEFYSSADKFGELQYLNPYSRDLTEISYEEKLKKYLESVLISDEMANRVRTAFDAYIFLSYRKKDRKYANELMRIIHNIPECRDIAIWFDEFLTPGESFRDNIDKILNDSKLFALLVTPNLLEEPDGKPNFVMSEEYPQAQKSGIDILPAEMVDTDKDTLKEKFEGIPDCVNPYEAELHARLLETVVKLATEANNTPEHNFLIGLAYLEGIDVETNRERGVKLIQLAAEKNLIEAVSKMVNMYENGIYFSQSIEEAITWQNRLIAILERKLKKTHNKSDLVSLFLARYHCAELYINIKEYSFAEAKINKVLNRLLSCKSDTGNIVNMRGDICNCILYAFLILGEISIKKGDLTECEKFMKKAQSFYTDLIIPYDNNNGDDITKLIIANYVALYLHIATLHKELHIYNKSLEYAKKALRLISTYLPETSTFYDRRAETMANEVAGDACFYCNDFKNAKSYYTKMYDLANINASDIDNTLYQRDFAYSCNRMGEIMLNDNRLKDAKEYFSESFKISLNIKNQNDEDDENIAFCYIRFGDISWRKNMKLTSVFYYRKALKIRLRIFEKYKDLDSTMHLAYSYVNLGRTSLFKRRYYFAEAKRLFEVLIEQSQIPDFYTSEIHKYIDTE